MGRYSKTAHVLLRNDNKALREAVSVALYALGYRVFGYNAKSFNSLSDLLVVWNGMKGRYVAAVSNAISLGVDVLFLERGFISRNEYYQANQGGVLHWSSFADMVSTPAPSCGSERLKTLGISVAGRDPVRGYVLVLGQVDSDIQLANSEVKRARDLQRLVLDAMPAGTQCYFRPHPSKPGQAQSKTTILPLLPSSKSEISHYNKTLSGECLKNALDGARFVVTINSGAIVEALTMGVPVLAFGPSMAINAGVAMRATVNTLSDDIGAMLGGWRPNKDAVINYLRWLAAKQWSLSELSDPDVFARILDDRRAF